MNFNFVLQNFKYTLPKSNFLNQRIFEQIQENHPKLECNFSEDIQLIHKELFEKFIKTSTFDSQIMNKLNDQEIYFHFEFSIQLKSQLYLQSFIDFIILNQITIRNCVSYLILIQNLVSQNISQSFKIALQKFTTYCFNYTVQNLDNVDENSILSLRKAKPKLQDKIIEQYIRFFQIFITNKSLEQAIKIMMSIKDIQCYLELLQCRRYNLIQYKKMDEKHTNISWKATNIKSMSTNFNFQQFNFQIYSQKTSHSSYSIFLRLLSLKKDDQLNIISEDQQIISFYFQITINDVKQQNIMFDHFVIDKKKDLLIKTFNETEQQEFKPNESINIRVYLSYDIIYSSILNYASRQASNIHSVKHMALNAQDLLAIMLSISDKNAFKQQIIEDIFLKYDFNCLSNDNQQQFYTQQLFNAINLSNPSIQNILNTNLSLKGQQNSLQIEQMFLKKLNNKIIQSNSKIDLSDNDFDQTQKIQIEKNLNFCTPFKHNELEKKTYSPINNKDFENNDHFSSEKNLEGTKNNQTQDYNYNSNIMLERDKMYFTHSQKNQRLQEPYYNFISKLKSANDLERVSEDQTKLNTQRYRYSAFSKQVDEKSIRIQRILDEIDIKQYIFSANLRSNFA